MDQMLLSVTCLAVEETWDAFVPRSLPASEAARLLGEAFEEATGGRYVASGCELLCREGGQRLDAGAPLARCELQNGDRLLLF